jgi:hypothetical protein
MENVAVPAERWLDLYAADGADLPLWWVSPPAMDVEAIPITASLRDALGSWRREFNDLPVGQPRPKEFDVTGQRLLAGAAAQTEWKAALHCPRRGRDDYQWVVTAIYFDVGRTALARS